MAQQLPLSHGVAQLAYLLALIGSAAIHLQGQTSPRAKLIVDDGHFEGSSFVKQFAVTADDRYLLVSDSKEGVRTYEVKDGSLVNELEGHSLEGDVYYSPDHDLLLTTGDLKVKLWDVPQQKLLKTFRQPFHSQFMRDVYIDSKKRFVFAQGVKYDFQTGKPVSYFDLGSRVAHLNLQRVVASQRVIGPYVETYFFRDKVYLFDRRTGQVRIYDAATDAPAGDYVLKDYKQGQNNYFDDNDGRLFISYKNGVRIVEIASGDSDQAIFDRSHAYPNVDRNSCYAISRDGVYLVAGSNQGVGLVVLKKVDPRKGFASNVQEVLRQNILVEGIAALHRSNRVIYADKTTFSLLDLDSLNSGWQTGAKILSLRKIRLAPNGKDLYLALGTENRINRHWFERTYPFAFDRFFSPIDEHWGNWKPQDCVSCLPAELHALWNDRPRTVSLRLHQGFRPQFENDSTTFAVFGTDTSTKDPVEGTVYSPSHRYSVQIKDFGTSVLYDKDRVLGRVADLSVIYRVEFSPDEHYVAMGGSGRWVAVVDLRTGLTVRKLYGESYISAISFSHDNRFVFTGSLKNEIMMWRLQDGKLIRRFSGSNGSINDTQITPDDKTLLSASQDGGLRFWEVSTGRLLLSAYLLHSDSAPELHGAFDRKDSISLACHSSGSTPLAEAFENNWVAVTPDGHFDTRRFEESKTLHWIVPDASLQALPLEILTRDYYEPRLVSRMLAGDALRPVQALQRINREVPAVRILGVKSGGAGLGPDARGVPDVSVTVDVQDVESHTQKDSNGTFVRSGAYDLRLFRDGQMVAQWPDVPAEEDARLGIADSDERRAEWRKLHQIPFAAGKASITFRNIRLPLSASGNKVEFTAYAFNSDRVKSLTTPPYSFQVPPVPSPRNTARRAYLITMGVDANESHWTLDLAVPSARKAQELLRRKLQAEYGDVVEVALNSELAPDSAQVLKSDARKDYLKAVLGALAGKALDEKVRAAIDPLRRLRAASPDDAVVVYIASHGYADPGGSFYLVPFDTGPGWGLTEDVLSACSLKNDGSPACTQAKTFLSRSISSAELTAWWRDVDAGEALMILDTCHAGASTGKEFRPGPLGDPGFGQLSYDKAMRILVAAQPAQTEQGTWVRGGEGQTLIIEALETAAKSDPCGSLAEWLKRTEQEVPRRIKALFPQIKERDLQLPELLDFAARGRQAAPRLSP